MTKRRVVITGLGAISPLGNTVADNWAAILKGQSGIGEITHFDSSELPVHFAGEVKNFTVTDFIDPKEARRLDPFIHFGIAAAFEAIDDSGLQITDENAERCGVALGSGIGGIAGIESAIAGMDAKGARKISPFYITATVINMLAGNVSIMRNLKGPNVAAVSACTTGAHNIGLAARMIQYGDADVMVAGGSEHAITKTCFAGFSSMRALSKRNDEPQKASRPWDADRDGFVMGEGAGVVVIEEYEHAKARGADIYAEIIGFGMSADAGHVAAVDMNGPKRCMTAALKDAAINAEDIAYLNAHATSTPVGDIAETEAIKAAFGSAANNVAVSSTKSMTGHLLGAAGGIEAVYTALAIRDNVAPPTINLDNPGEGCDLDYVPNTARDMTIDIAASNSFGFGGTNATMILRKV